MRRCCRRATAGAAATRRPRERGRRVPESRTGRGAPPPVRRQPGGRPRDRGGVRPPPVRQPRAAAPASCASGAPQRRGRCHCGGRAAASAARGGVSARARGAAARAAAPRRPSCSARPPPRMPELSRMPGHAPCVPLPLRLRPRHALPRRPPCAHRIPNRSRRAAPQLLYRPPAPPLAASLSTLIPPAPSVPAVSPSAPLQLPHQLHAPRRRHSSPTAQPVHTHHHIRVNRARHAARRAIARRAQPTAQI
jgi:hypothetical protein